MCVRHRILVDESNLKTKASGTRALGHGSMGMEINECASCSQRQSFFHLESGPRHGAILLRELKIAHGASTANSLEHLFSRCLNHGWYTTNPCDWNEFVLAS